MPGAADWQDLPNSLTNAWDQSQQADDWALEQNAQNAQSWADTQRSIPTPSDSLTNPIGTGNAPAPAPAPPAPAAGGAALPPASGAAAPPPAPTPAASTPPPSGGDNQYSPYDDTFKKYAGDLANDPEFIKIVAAGTLAESSWNTNSTTGDGGHSWGLFQMHDKGMGAGMGDARLDPDAASAVMVPRYADAYKRFSAQGLTGPALAAAVGHAAELNADASGSGYAAAYKTLSNGNAPAVNASVPQNFLSNAANTVSNAAGNVASAAGNAAGAAGQAIGNAASDIGQNLGTAANNAVNMLTTPGGIKSAVATTLQNNGDVAGMPGSGAVLKAAGAFLMQPTVLDQIQAYMQLSQKPADQLTPEDQQRLFNARVAIGGMSMGGGDNGVNNGGRPLFGRGGVPGADVGRNPVPPGTGSENLQDQLAQSALQMLVKQARDAGMSDDDIANVFRKAGGSDQQINDILHPASPDQPVMAQPQPTSSATTTPTVADAGDRAAQPVAPVTPSAADQPPPVQFDQQGNVVAQNGSPTFEVPQANPMQNVDAQGNLQPGVENIPGPAGGAEPPTMPQGQVPGSKIISARNGPAEPIPPENLPNIAGVDSSTMQAAYQRIDQRIQDPTQSDAAKAQLDSLVQSGDAGAVARFMANVEGNGLDATDVLRQARTGSMAGGLTSLGKVAVSPIIQTAMRAPVGALKAIVTGNPGDIATGLQGGLEGLASGAQDALQTMRYGINMRSALTGGAQGGYGFAPGLDVLGSNAATRTLGTALTGLVRAHGAVADLAAGIGRGANAALGATPEQAAEAGQQWALRSGQYGFVGGKVANAINDLRSSNPALDVVGQILVPFYRVGYNAFTQGVERSPLGLAGRLTDAAQGKPLDTGKLANNMFGVGLAWIGFNQAAQGNITGERPQNGAPQWSVRIPEQANLGPMESLAKRDTNGNLWVPLRDLGPAGESLAQSAALYEGARDGNGDVAAAAGKTAYEYASHVMDTTWLSTINDLFVGLDRRSAVGDVKDMQTSRSPITRAAAQRNLTNQGKYLGESLIPQAALAGQVGKITGQPDLSSYFLNQANPANQPPAQAPVPSVNRYGAGAQQSSGKNRYAVGTP